MTVELAQPVEPGGVIGVLGGGQLARMLCLAAAKIGLRAWVLDPEAGCPAAACAAGHIETAYDDRAGLQRLAEVADVVTYEFENVPAQSAEQLTELGAVAAPGPAILEIAQDRVREKAFVRDHGAMTADFAPVEAEADLIPALARIGTPALLKTRRLGYDGKGQARIEHADKAADAWRAVREQPAILEALVPFDREISVIAARSWSGEVKAFDITENVHSGGVLRTATAPAAVAPSTAERARDLTFDLLHAAGYVGVMAVEYFVLDDGEVLVNEIAPRVHNSGHWTQDACVTDQFEQHVRAICGWPLGDPTRRSPVRMTNLFGDDVEAWTDYAARTGGSLHLYGKREARPGRKMGHVTELL